MVKSIERRSFIELSWVYSLIYLGQPQHRLGARRHDPVVAVGVASKIYIYGMNEFVCVYLYLCVFVEPSRPTPTHDDAIHFVGHARAPSYNRNNSRTNTTPPPARRPAPGR